MSSSTPRRRGSHDAFSPTPPWMMMMMTTMTPSTTMRTPRSRVARRAKTSPSPSPSNASARRRVRGARRVADGWLHSVGRHHCRPRRLCCRPVVVVVVGHAVGDARCAMRGASSSSSSSSSSSVGRQHRRRARDTNARASSELDASDGRAAPRWFFFWCCADRRSHLARTSLADALGVHARRRRRRRRTKTTNQPSHAFAAVRSRVYDVDETRGLI